MKKILILVPDLNLQGGVANYYRTLKLDADKNVTYFTVNKQNKQTPFETAKRLLLNYFRFFYMLYRHNYEVVVVNPSMDTGKSYFRDSVFIIIARLLNKKTIVFFRGWLDSYEEKIKKSKFKSLLFKWSYASAGSYITLGNIFKKKLIGLGVPDKSQFFLESTVADSSYLKELDLDKKHLSFKKNISFLFLSRIEKEKGLHIALNAYELFLEKNPGRDSCFLVAGDGDALSDAMEYANQKHIPNIHFLGNVSGDRKKEILITSHILILPSISGDGLPNTVLECMLYGMPIISRITAGIPDVVQQHVNGYLTESLDFAVFADFMSTIASNEVLYKKMSENNQRIALEKYTSERVRERILKIYNSF
ncbi:glycosyltransferase family 4 protein [Chryseolinea sp. H1M3-3]|uniref:glycosyltransferase family 4 protein n=1 Tax=Chryseolinea sp. H1M3-3 TaxID=3034144 RepID=UPI0023EC1D64|nr:glycosyltransferase family 4 protein [Chryseolinea sp. H1M3-3]